MPARISIIVLKIAVGHASRREASVANGEIATLPVKRVVAMTCAFMGEVKVAGGRCRFAQYAVRPIKRVVDAGPAKGTVNTS